MIVPSRVAAGLAACLAFARIATAQEEAPAPEAAPAAQDASPAPRKPKPRPKRAAPRGEPTSEKAGSGTQKARTGPAPDAGSGAALPEPPANPATSAVTPPSATPFAAPAVACDPGKSVFYERDGTPDARAAGLWVTRTGTVTVDNPLRPLTPDVTRVLQVVVGAKLATVHGPDLTALRRGPSPGVLEGVLGGPIRWDAVLATLPETLALAPEAGAAPAEMRFRECGDAPAAKAAPVARRRPPKGEAGEAKPPVEGRRTAPKPAVRTPPGFNLPQGAIP